MRAATKLAVALAAIASWALGHSAIAAAANPEIKHVFIIVLENENADETFAAGSHAPYLSKTLRSQGAYLPNYYATSHLSLGNYISMVSGQAANIATQIDCPIYLDFLALPVPIGADGQVAGQGCVYPTPTVQTIANQLEAHGYTWKGYMEDMGASCRHPDLNTLDGTQSAVPGDQYAARHNPFVYFHSIIDSPTCAANDVDYSRLAGDLNSAETTPNYAFITPNLCNDGHDSPCVTGEPGGLITADAWLQNNVPRILNSPGFKDHGLLIVTFDEAEGSPPEGDAGACCNQQPGPNAPLPGIFGPGGGKIGAVALSPCIEAGTVDETPYNHFSLLKSTEDFFGLPHLGFARQAGLASFGERIFTRPACPTSTIAKKCKKRAKKKHKKRAAEAKKKKKSCKKKKRGKKKKR